MCGKLGGIPGWGCGGGGAEADEPSAVVIMGGVFLFFDGRGAVAEGVGVGGLVDAFGLLGEGLVTEGGSSRRRMVGREDACCERWSCGWWDVVGDVCWS